MHQIIAAMADIEAFNATMRPTILEIGLATSLIGSLCAILCVGTNEVNGKWPILWSLVAFVPLYDVHQLGGACAPLSLVAVGLAIAATIGTTTNRLRAWALMRRYRPSRS